jgi:signal peptidase I
MKEKNELFEWIKVLTLAVLFAVGIRFFLMTPIVVNGASMMPTLEDEDKLIINKIGPKISDYDRFDIIVFKSPEGPNYVKRIIGVPGDHIEYIEDELFINGEKFEEPYLDEYKTELIDPGTLTEDFRLEEYLGEMTVPEDSYFVLGDNRRKSNDSRNPDVGFIPKDVILGKAELVFWPFDHFSKVE